MKRFDRKVIARSVSLGVLYLFVLGSGRCIAYADEKKPVDVPPLAYPLPRLEVVRTVRGKVLNPDGSPAVGAKVSTNERWMASHDRTTTDANGSYRLEMRSRVVGKSVPENIGYFLDFDVESADGLSESTNIQRQQDLFSNKRKLETLQPGEVPTINLVPKTVTRRWLRMYVQDELGKPIEGAVLISRQSRESWTTNKAGNALVPVHRCWRNWRYHAYSPGYGAESIEFFSIRSDLFLDNATIEKAFQPVGSTPTNAL